MTVVDVEALLIFTIKFGKQVVGLGQSLIGTVISALWSFYLLGRQALEAERLHLRLHLLLHEAGLLGAGDIAEAGGVAFAASVERIEKGEKERLILFYISDTCLLSQLLLIHFTFKVGFRLENGKSIIHAIELEELLDQLSHEGTRFGLAECSCSRVLEMER